ncbi:hypothetical protein GNE00_03535 [Pseudomonas sp. JL972]|uniref:hypothetical protein n=1 Tax=Stutzerimonas degradans TaxID=2968968 RepID=UPI0012D8EB3B|nr:hypothetical protein [Stutzerimonas degradans]MTZ12800.1 hypothetical protein [Stutzerimonas degradans]
MPEIVDALREHIKERAASPLSGAFIVSWLLINHKLLVVLFSDVKPWVKFGYINNHLYPDLASLALSGIAYPLLMASFYIFIYPLPARKALLFTLEQKRRTTLEKFEAEKLIPLSYEQVLERIAPLRDKIADLEQEAERRETTTDRLKKIIEGQEKSISELGTKISEKQQALDSLEVDLSKAENEIKAAKSVAEKHLSDLENIKLLYNGMKTSHEALSEEKAAALTKIENLTDTIKRLSEDRRILKRALELATPSASSSTHELRRNTGEQMKRFPKTRMSPVSQKELKSAIDSLTKKDNKVVIKNGQLDITNAIEPE